MAELPPDDRLTVPDASDGAPARALPPEVDEELVENVEALVGQGQQGMVLNLIADLHPADLGELVSHLSVEAGQALLRWLPDEQAGAVLPELESALRSDLLEAVEPHQLVALLDQMDTDDAADVLADVDDAVAEAVLPHLEDSAEVGALMGYAEDTAGGLMETDLVAVPETATVAEATEEVRRKAEDIDPHFVYTVDTAGRLTGIVPLRRLLLAPASAPLADLALTDYVFVEPDLDQEEVARLMERYDLVALPVVSADGRLLGRITIDDVVDVIREEAEEDIQRAAGLVGEEELSSSVFEVSRGRLPWLAIGMAGAFFSGLVIKTFEGELEQAIVLASFIPLVTATGGNAAIQSAAIVVQGLTSGELWVGEGLRRIGKELAVALLNGVVLGVLLGVLVVVLARTGVPMGDPLRLALTVGLTLLCVVLLATTNGALVPFLLKRMGIDPATSMGPFVTTLNDILGLTVYFLIASAVYL
ncbi:MAG TPA: magnesium transporter [Rubricoccaceae bacterium]|nr:magnesium transporter [Rubricoccaceae bacterium]